MLKKPYFIALSLLFSASTMATELARFTLENGAEVMLNDDFTWQYVILEETQTSNNELVNKTIESGLAAPSVPVTSQLSAPKLTATAIKQSELMATNVSEGVRVTYKTAVWDDDELGLTFELHNSSTANAVMVKAEVTLFNDQGIKIKTEELTPWQAQYRSPETYLRKGQTRMSRTLWIEGIDAKQWKKQLIQVKVLEVETR